MKKILLIENESDLRRMLALALEKTGYEVFQAEDGQQGLEQAKDVSPDLIICDVMMPRMDGHQFLQKLRASDFGGTIPFMVMTARQQMREHFEAAGADAFLDKPFEVDEFLSKAEALLNRPPADRKRKQPTILLIDDEADLQKLVRMTLESQGYHVVVANNGLEGLDKLKIIKPSMIILDMNMPKMGGIEFYKHIAGDDGRTPYPVLILTARANMESFVEDLDVAGFLAKPFEIDELIQTVEKIVGV